MTNYFSITLLTYTECKLLMSRKFDLRKNYCLGSLGLLGTYGAMVVKWNHSRIYLARSLRKCKHHNYGRTFDYLITSTDEKQIYFQWPKLFSANSILFTWFLISFFSFLQFNAIIWENISMLKEYNHSTLWLMKLKEKISFHRQTL